MSKNFYIGSSGRAREGKEIYVGVSGRARKVIKGYVGIGGVCRQFWPGIYTWNRYTIMQKETYSYEYIEEPRHLGYTITSGREIFYTTESNPENIFDSNLGYFTPMSSVKFYDRRVDFLRNKFIATYDNPTSLQLLVDWQESNSGGYQTYFTDEAKINTTYENISGDYVDQVFSEDINAYPENGIQGDYWYVLQ